MSGRTEKKVQEIEEACAEKPSYKNNFGFPRPSDAPATARISKSRSEKNNGRYYWWTKDADGEFEYFQWADEVDTEDNKNPVSKKPLLKLVKLFTKNPPAPSSNVVKPVPVRASTPPTLPPFKAKSNNDVRSDNKSLTAFNMMQKMDTEFGKFIKQYREDHERVSLQLSEIQKQIDGIEQFLVLKSADSRIDNDGWIDTRKRKTVEVVDDDEELTQEFVEKKKKTKTTPSSYISPKPSPRAPVKRAKQLDLTADSPPPRIPDDLKYLHKSLGLFLDEEDDDVKDAKGKNKK